MSSFDTRAFEVGKGRLGALTALSNIHNKDAAIGTRREVAGLRCFLSSMCYTSLALSWCCRFDVAHGAIMSRHVEGIVFQVASISHHRRLRSKRRYVCRATHTLRFRQA